MTLESKISGIDRLAFEKFMATAAGYPPCRHKMSLAMAQRAREGKLAAKQVDIFTHAMLARIYPTIPNIAGLVRIALWGRENELAEAAMIRLVKELKKGKTLQEKAEDAFNTLRTAFGLPQLSPKEAYETLRLSASYKQKGHTGSDYKDFRAIASWLRQCVSRNNGHQEEKMANIFEVFEACRDKIGEKRFKESVLPYVRFHSNKLENNNILA